MCMTCTKEVSIEKVEAWKVFAVRKGKLETAFMRSRYTNGETDKPIEVIPYEVNQKIKVVPETSSFFAFEHFNDAYRIAEAGRYKWNTINDQLVVLPVTLYNVVTTGKFHVVSEDVQCMDGYYPAFEAKEIEIHDSDEIRRDIFRQIAKKYLQNRMTCQSLSFLQVQAFEQLLNLDLFEGLDKFGIKRPT